MKRTKELQTLIKRTKDLRRKYKHPYAGTEHFLLAVLEIEKYRNIIGITFEEFEKKMLDAIGTGEDKEKMDIMSPMLSRIIKYSETIDQALIEFLEEREGVAYRLLSELVDEETIEEIWEALNKEEKKKESIKNLPKYLTNLNDKEYITNPAIGRDIPIEEMERTLLKMNKPNILLIGEAGVGKTAIVEGLAYRIKNGEVNDKLKDKIILSAATSSLVAGTKYRGEFEERMEKLCEIFKNNPDYILFIDEMHTTINAGGAEGAIDMANILKPYLSRGDIKVIGATTLKESDIITKDEAYNRRFTKILINEPRLSTVVNILEKSIPKFEDFYNIEIDKSLMEYITNTSRELNGKYPDKSIDLLENVCADTVWRGGKTFGKKDIKRIAEELLEKQQILETI